MIQNVNPISLASNFLNIYTTRKDANSGELIQLSSATGFFYKRNNEQYFVTNLHVVSGRDIFTEQPENKNGALPEIIKSNCALYYDSEKRIDGGYYVHISLYDNYNNPVWLVHPKYKRDVDLAIIKIKNNLFCLNDIPSDNVEIGVADEVFVIGYPLALGSNENRNIPIWKRATIASEPTIPYFNDGRKTFVIDATTRPGMSGSPVFAYSHFATSYDNEGMSFSMSPQRRFSFLGVYSGRLRNRGNAESFLGLVWKKELIDEIIDGNVRDELY